MVMTTTLLPRPRICVEAYSTVHFSRRRLKSAIRRFEIARETLSIASAKRVSEMEVPI